MTATTDRRAADLAVMEMLLRDPTLTECEARRQLGEPAAARAPRPAELVAANRLPVPSDSRY